MRIALGSSILASIAEKLQIDNPNISVLGRPGATLDIGCFLPELNWVESEEVTEVLLLFLGGNDLLAGKSIRKGGKIHYHRHLRRKLLNVEECVLKYNVLIDELKSRFKKATFKICVPLARRCFAPQFTKSHSLMCSECLNFNALSKVESLEKSLKFFFKADEKVEILSSKRLHKFVYIRKKPRPSKGWIRFAGKNIENLQHVYSELLSTRDQIHLSPKGKNLLVSFLKKSVI